MSERIPEVQDLGIGLVPGDPHYRAFVGPPEDYDLVSAMSFGLLTALGLRQHHALLDIGCGSMRVGRLLIPYLNVGGYTGFEPNAWLVEEGIDRECGQDLLRLKQPRFVHQAEPESLNASKPFDFALAQSIFSHTGPDLLDRWLKTTARVLAPTGVLVATFLPSENDPTQTGWVYPECVTYRTSTIEAIAIKHRLQFRILDWRHPRQSWAIFAHEGFATDWLDDIQLSWNSGFDAGRWSAP